MDVTCGYREEYPNGDIYYYGGETEQGVVYKDMDAWKSGEGVCYIGENEFENGWCCVNYEGNTRDEIIADMAEYLLSCDVKFIEQCAEYVLQTCDWQCLTTLMEETDWDEDIRELYQEGIQVWFEGSLYTIMEHIGSGYVRIFAMNDSVPTVFDVKICEVYRKSDKVCEHCGGPLYHEKYDNTMDHYPYFCPECDENFFEFEAR